MRTLTFFLLTLLTTVGSQKLHAQTGPGGVGNSSSNNLWLRADSGLYQSQGGTAATSDGDPVGEWQDQSGNNNHFIQGTSSQRPVIRTGSNGINNMPTVEFDGTDDVLVDADGESYINGLSGFTFFFITRSNTTGSDSGFFDTENPDNQDDVVSLRYDDAGANSGRDEILKYGINTTGGNQQLETSVTIGGDAAQSTNTQMHAITWESGVNLGYYLNGTNDTGVDLNGSAVTGSLQNSSNVIIGQSVKDDPPSWNGDVAEVILYDNLLNTTERRVVENYLSSKYNISIPNDYYVYEVSHSTDIAGIGRTGSSDVHLSSYSDILGLEFATADFADGTYVFLAHQDGSTSFSTSETPNGDSNLQKIGREWRVDVTGATTEDVTVNADLTGFSIPSGYNDYGIMVDSDGDFTSGATFYPVSNVSGDTYQATNVTVSDGDYITIVAVQRELQLTNGTQAEFESATGITIPVELNYASATDVTVDLNDTGAGTASGSDYSFSTETITVSAGTLTANGTNLSLSNDTDVESTETIIFSLSNLSGADFGSTTSLTFSINDDDNPRKIQFTNASSSANEGAGSVDIEININNVDNTNDTEVDYAVTGGDATGGGTDYTLASGTAIISSGNTTTNITVTLNDDALNEVDETVEITLSNPVNANLGSTFAHTLTINDNDSQPDVSFTSSSSSGDESTSTVNIDVSLSATNGSDTEVTFSIDGSSSATGSGTDYTLDTSSPLVIPSGDLTGSITLLINDDGTEESDENVIINLDGANIANLVSPTTHTYTILDNDGLGSTGSGGVGDSESIVAWFRADKGVYQTSGGSRADTDGQTIEEWQDQSGNGYHLTQATTADRPVYRTGGNGINSQPVLEFDGAGDFMENLNADNEINGASGFSAFMVVRNNDGTANDNGIFDTEDGDTQDDVLAFRYDAAGANGGASSTAKFGISNGSNQYQYEAVGGIQTTIAEMYALTWGSGGTLDLYINGTLDSPSAEDAAIGGTISNAVKLVVGAGPKYGGDANGWNGDIAEFVFYNTNINSSRRIIVENYLAEKYGLTIATDNYTDATFNNDIIGIGREPDGSHLSAQNAGLILRENGAIDNNGEYVLAGHSGAAANDASDYLGSVASEARWDREWVIEITGTLTGELIVGFDFSDYGLSFSPQNASNYQLLRRSNSTTDFTAVSVTGTSISGDQILFTVPVGNLKTVGGSSSILASGDQFTLGSSDDESSPLPVTLTGFQTQTSANNAYPLITWETASERENYGFHLERRKSDEESWQYLTFIDGQGTSTQSHQYSYTDTELTEAGTYQYRLIQEDFDGSTEIFDSIEFVFDKPKESTLNGNYPNPFNPVTTISYEIANPSDVKIEVFNVLGRRVATLVNDKKSPGRYEATFDATHLASGIYIVRMINQGSVKTQKMLLIK